ncbi:P-loop containing nucleoside triphosphate hydrolase protein [Epithele typhae]|uniref:P-loop containing nucleoside triphosphate hydrolase protein n=1 Tax=Epithele typhae TaxID=378194 RepID=UPI002007FC20|nr:P-loop containing nucleoside triphosphate hydrolase protein [Epithele typhae]XP_047872719.1 P-loop containing nucleoside triphosphate hydrolase protein [Epithele typhae]KAH9910556.1 P-loop containing nucleoside triphosphate hydrolase protein [Epithele typhae]KAH9914878.1 P-loop containing nucleoside triphosphate hydrolase protein [Epithele typhae]
MNCTPIDSRATPSAVFAFNSTAGRALCRQIISARFGYDPHDYQLDGVTRALDGLDILAITPTGSGKTGFLTMYLVVMQAVMEQPLLLPSPPSRHFQHRAAMVVVCPTIALQVDMATKFTACGLRPIVINKDALTTARPRNLWDDVPDSDVLLVAPEQLDKKGFERLVNNSAYKMRVVALGVDEAHLLNTWGKTFRPEFEKIGPTRMRFNQPVVIALTATLRAGPPLRAVYDSLGLYEGPRFHLIRRSNARHDLRIIIRLMKSTVNATAFPELEWVLSARRNILIFCRTLKTCHDIMSYLDFQLKCHAATGDELAPRVEVRSHNGLNWPSYNDTTLDHLRSGSDNMFSVVLATDTLSVGIDVA